MARTALLKESGSLNIHEANASSAYSEAVSERRCAESSADKYRLKIRPVARDHNNGEREQPCLMPELR